MKVEYLGNIQAIVPSISHSSYNIFKDQINTQTLNPNNFQINQDVQFLKLTVLPNGKISCKESMGKVLQINHDYAEILDTLGDIVQTNLHYIKAIGV